MAATMITTRIFWDVTPCCVADVNQRFGGKHCPHPQNRILCEARKNGEDVRRGTTEIRTLSEPGRIFIPAVPLSVFAFTVPP
jgi:hypothetical protein